MHPSHIPFKAKSQAVFLHFAGHFRPGGGLFRDRQKARISAAYNRIQMLEELDCLQVLIAAVLIGYPLAVALTVIKIQHRGHGVHTDTVDMVFLDPEKSIGDQEVPDFILTVVKDLRSPVRMLSDPRVRMLENTLSVKPSQSMGIRCKMCRNPIQDHTDLMLMQRIDQIHEIIRRTVSRCGCIVARHLISPGTVIRVFGDPHQLHMRIFHFL